ISADDERGGKMRLQSDGKIVVAGSAVYRHLPDGSLDPLFGIGGKASGPEALFFSVALQGDGKLVSLCGVQTRVGLINYECLVARLLTDGSLDAGFGINGQVVTQFSLDNGLFKEVLLQGDGRIVAGGITIQSNIVSHKPVMARYLNDDGTPLP